MRSERRERLARAVAEVLDVLFERDEEKFEGGEARDPDGPIEEVQTIPEPPKKRGRPKKQPEPETASPYTALGEDIIAGANPPQDIEPMTREEFLKDLKEIVAANMGTAVTAAKKILAEVGVVAPAEVPPGKRAAFLDRLKALLEEA